MRLGIKLLLGVIAVLILFFCSVYLFFMLFGKSIVTKDIEKFTHAKVSMAEFSFTPSFSLRIKGLNIEGLARIDSLSVSPSMIGFITGNIVFNNAVITKPEVTYKIAKDKKADSPIAPSPELPLSPASAAPSQKADTKQSLHLIIKRLKIHDGTLNLIDQNVSSDGLKITVKNINFNLSNFYLSPFSVVTNFALSGKIPWQEGQDEGKITLEGWINLVKKSMQATLKFEDIDGIYLYPYYSNWVDLEKARIEKAKLNFSSNIQGLNNDVVADCHLELTDIVRKPRPPEESQEKEKAERIADAVLDIFRALNEGKIELNFTIRTKMDKPEFGFTHIKTAFEDKLAQGRKGSGLNPGDIFGVPAKLIEGTLKGVTDMTTAVIGGTISAGKQLGKVVEDTFKREKKEED